MKDAYVEIDTGWLAVGFDDSLHETRKLRRNGEPCSSYAKVRDLLVRLFYLSPSQSNSFPAKLKSSPTDQKHQANACPPSSNHIKKNPITD
jgi:hypothetical protein